MHSILSRMVVGQASHAALCGSGVSASVRLLHRSSRMCFERSPKKDNNEKAASASCTGGPPFKLSSSSLSEDPQIIAIVKSIMNLEADEVDSLNRLLKTAVQQEEEEVRYYEKKVEQALAKTFNKEIRHSKTSSIKDANELGTTNALSSQQHQSPVDSVAVQTSKQQQSNEGVLPEPDHDLNGTKTGVSPQKPSSEVDKKCAAALDSPPVKASVKELNKTPRTLVVPEPPQAAESHFISRPIELGKNKVKTEIKTAETQQKKSFEEKANTDKTNQNFSKDAESLTSNRTIKGSGFILEKPGGKNAKEETKLVKKEPEKSMESAKKERRAKQVKQDSKTAAEPGKLSKDSFECKSESVKSKVIDQANINFPKDVIRLKPKRIFNLSLSKKRADSTVEKKVVQQPLVKPQIKKKNESKPIAKCTNGWWFWQKSTDDKDPSDKN